MLWALPAMAGEGDRLLAQVRKQFEARALWEIGFAQELISPLDHDTSRSSGRLLACPGGAFRVDLQALHLLSDGKNLWRWETGGSQVLLERPGQSPDVLLPHQLLILLEERFRVTSLKAEGPRRKRLQLTPKSGSEYMRDVVVVLAQEGGQWWPVDMAFTDFSDTRFRFLVKNRRSFPDRAARKAELTYKLPAGMELIDLRTPGAANAPK
jgi:hypothetical protein